MRPSLNQFEQIEAYLTATLNKEELSTFTTTLENSSELREQVEFQRLLIQATNRVGLRNEIQSVTGTGASGLTNFWKWILGVGIVLISVGAIWYSSRGNDQSNDKLTSSTLSKENKANKSFVHANAKDSPEESNSSSEKSPASYKNSNVSTNIAIYEESNKLDTWLPLKRQYFELKAEKGATIEGDDGTLIVIPSNAFVDEQGNLIKGDINFELIEALKFEDMIAYNLTTMNDGKALSSGGMIYMQPYSNGKKVNINKDRPVYVEIPTVEFIPEMMAWKGEVSDGKINWTSPTPLKKFLTIIDLSSLDFIPEGFDDAVEAGLPFKNHKKISEHLVDSLYYSLGGVAVVSEPTVPSVKISPKTNISDQIIMDKKEFPIKVTEKKGRKKEQPEFTASTTIEDTCPPLNTGCYIDPISVKTIQTKNFKKTFVATKEFEERIQAMHLLKNGQEVLDLYLANLNKDLGEVDALACKKLTGDQLKVFNAFAAQKLPNVDNDNIHQEQLTNYYNEKRSEYQKDLNKLKSSYREKTTAELTKLQNNLVELQKKKNALMTSNSGDITRKDERKGAGISPPQRSFPRASVANSASYATPWYSGGWMNIDRYLKELNSDKNVEVVVSLENNKPNSVVYQCLDLIQTIIPLNMDNTKGKAVFPARSSASSLSMESTFCLAISKQADQLFYAEKRYNPYTTNQVDLAWASIGKDELYPRLQALSPLGNQFIADMKKQEQMIAQQLKIRLKQVENQRKAAAIQAEKQRKTEALLAEQLNEIQLEQKVNQQKIEEIQAQLMEENAFIQSLLDKLDRCKEGGVNYLSVIKDVNTFFLPELLYLIDGNVKELFRMTCPDENGNCDSLTNFNLVVTNGEDEVVYFTTDPNFKWDGTYNGNGFVPEGNYSCSLQASTRSGFPIEFQQSLKIIYKRNSKRGKK